jgi:hypothetical protein
MSYSTIERRYSFGSTGNIVYRVTKFQIIGFLIIFFLLMTFGGV